MNHSRLSFFQLGRKFLPLLILTVLAMPMAAQTGLGVVRGTVADASKAVIPGAKATLMNTATGVADSVETSQVGVFYFGAVKPGPYVLTLEVPHFKRRSTTLPLEVAQTAVIDPA